MNELVSTLNMVIRHRVLETAVKDV